MRILKTEEEKGFITILIIYNLVVPNTAKQKWYRFSKNCITVGGKGK